MSKVLTASGIVLGAAMILSACHPHYHHVTVMGDEHWGDNGDKALVAATTLNCPQIQGDLTRVSAAGDGSSCTYQRGQDGEVVLSLLPLNGQQPRAALAPMETALQALVPANSDSSMVSVEAQKGGGGGDKAKVDLPGLHIDANGDKAKVRILGVTINADGKNAEVHAGAGDDTTTVHAGPGGAVVRTVRVGAKSVNLVYILAGDAAGPSGYRADGYLARGPVAGPLVVGQFKSKAEHHDGDEHDLEALINLNLKDAS